MTVLGYTPGGSPIFFGGTGSRSHPVSKTLYRCSEDERHRLTKNQAKSSGGKCTHCGAWLSAFKPRAEDLPKLKRELSIIQEKIRHIENLNEGVV